MANKRITEAALILYTGVLSGDVLLVGQTAADKKIKISELKKYTLGNKIIGGNSTGDIATTDANQILTNKVLMGTVYTSTILESLIITTNITNPGMNGSTLTASGTAINNVAATSATTALLNHIVGATLNIQTSLNGKVNRYNTALKYVISYGLDFTSTAGGAHNVTVGTIRTALGLGAQYGIDPLSVQVQVYLRTSATNEVVSPTINVDKSGGLVSNIGLKELGASTNYTIVIHFYLAASGA